MVARSLTDPDLQALDEIWPIGRQLVIPDGGIVVIAGAFKGRYMHYIAELYPAASKIWGFEPQLKAAEDAFWRTHRYQNCFVTGVALGAERNDAVPMGRWDTDGCSLVAFDGKVGKTKMIEFEEAMKRYKLDIIDCFICNMEGYEYHLLPHIFKNKLHNRIKSMAIQFHPVMALGEDTIKATLNEYYGEPIQSPGWFYWRMQ